MAEGRDGLFSKMPKEFDRFYGNLPESYVASHALVAMLSARLEWLTGALVNNAESALGWPESESAWPYKFSARLRWLRSALAREGVTEQLRELGSTFPNTAERVNAARNDILHSAILGHASDGRL